VQKQLPVVGVHVSEKPCQLPQVATLFAPKPSHLWPIAVRSDCSRSLGRFVTILHELVERKLQCSGHFFQRFNGRNGVAVFNAGDVASEQASALLDVALGEFLFLPQFAEAVSYHHSRIIPLRNS
jgi:hypothetical protein